jgi:hypothetical protein
VPHILREGLRRQLQPLDHGEVREQLVGEFMDGHPRADRQGGGLDDLSSLWGDRLHACFLSKSMTALLTPSTFVNACFTHCALH